MSISDAGDVATEQQYVSMLYERLDRLRERASGYLVRDADRAAWPRPTRACPSGTARPAEWSRRLGQLNAAENGLCFGRLDLDDGERRYVGRLGIVDDEGDYESLLLDWRAPAARPFYVATAARPEGVRRRRHIRTRLREVTRVDDEVLDLADPEAARDTGPAGEAALLAALGAARTGRMADIVATIQAEQDHVIRAPHGGVLVVQGGAGTGKTAVALHRAAYLLYTYRRQLERRGVLVVGPNSTFLRYIGDVLPALGETAVVLSPVAGLFPGVTARPAGAGGGRRDQGPGRRWPTCWRPRSRTASRSRTVRWCWSSTARRYGSRPRRSGAPGPPPAAPAGRTTRPGRCSSSSSSPRWRPSMPPTSASGPGPGGRWPGWPASSTSTCSPRSSATTTRCSTRWTSCGRA